MQFSVTIFVIVLLLGVIQLALGVVVGYCVPIRRARPAKKAKIDGIQLPRLAKRLRQLIAGVAVDVDQHQTQISRISREFISARSEDPELVSELVVNTVGQVVQANQRLQARLNEAEEKLLEQSEKIESHMAEARTDPLTRLPNRRAFDDELAELLAEWESSQTRFCLMMVDIDRFKELNDHHGHLAGDHVLRSMARVLQTALRAGDMIARIGGEEFAAILPDTSDTGARRVTEKVRAAIAAQAFPYEEHRLKTTVSLGLTVVQFGDKSTSLLRRADEALYTAKRSGRNCAFFHDGRICRRIGPATGPSDEGEPLVVDGQTDEETVDVAELAAICDDLRARISEVAQQQ